jgi:hypothetical protein
MMQTVGTCTNKPIQRLVLLSAVAIFFAAPRVLAQQKLRPSVSQNEILAKPMIWDNFHWHPIKDLNGSLVFTFVTSWIPGEDHAGRFRYKITVTPGIGDNVASVESAKARLLKRAEECQLFIVVSDTGGFKLREFPLLLGEGLKSDQVPVSLYENNAVQMDASEYRSLVGDRSDSGIWSISWRCPSDLSQ